jgi:hypothetical protein
MSGPHAPDARDDEIASLRQLVASLEKQIDEAGRRYAIGETSRFHESNVVKGSIKMLTDHMADALIRLGKVETAASTTTKTVDDLEYISNNRGETINMMIDHLEDALLRLGRVERKLFPNLDADLERARKVLGPGGDGSEYKLDRGAPRKPK